MRGGGVEGVERESEKEEGEVTDTPERAKNHQIAASVGRFEESPVFNFLNSLSPINPVKSIHITQTINPLSFASLPSVFTSPHVSSLRESRFLRRHQLSDPSEPEFSSDDAIKNDTDKLNTDVTKKSNKQQQQENASSKKSDADVADESSYDCSKFVVYHAEDYICNSPNSDLKPSHDVKAKNLAEYACDSSSQLVLYSQEASQPYGSDVNPEGQIDQNKETASASCDWESLIVDASDLLIFESPDDREAYKKSTDSGMSFCMTITTDSQNVHSICGVGAGEPLVEGNELENSSTRPGEGDETVENPGEKMDYEDLSGFHRGMRRRCLVFEMGGSRRKRLEENPGPDSPALMQNDGNTSSQKRVTKRTLPGIGLHLNALATTPKDYKIVGLDSSSSGRLLIGPGPSVNFHPSAINQELLNNNFPVASPERQIDAVVENGVLAVEDACQTSGYIATEEINQSTSPKKKRRRVEQAGEAEACKRCNCKKSKCLKLYCECFAAGVYCVEPCACIDCFNKPAHEDTVLATRKQIESRNPLAFAPKVIRGSDSLAETGDDSSKTPASARHKRGCNCRKSGCLKKYCECFQGGVGCSINCRCEGCKNAFGRKDGSEADIEENETETAEKSSHVKSLLKTPIENERIDATAPPATPLQDQRQLVQVSFSSKKRPPRSSLLSIGCSSSARQGLGQPSLVQPLPETDNKLLEAVGEDDMPEFLREGSPVDGVNSLSPNKKRVSPPHNIGMSPGLRSSRKLILKSIPSFPSLTHNQ